MRKHIATLLTVLFVLCCLVNSVYSDITYPTYYIPDTGQTQSYTNTFGEDSDYTSNPQSYTKLDAQGNDLPDSATTWSMVRDNVTGLIWQKDSAGPMTYKNAYNYCNSCNKNSFCGHNDWRIPNIRELATIVNSGRCCPAINTTFFPNTPSKEYWSITFLYNYPLELQWGVDFQNGMVTYYGKTSHQSYIRLVRGQTSNYYLVNNNDGTATDTCTGLMWQQEEATEKMTWEQAISYCEGLSLAGYNDWRLPNRNELQTLANYERGNPAIDTTIFPGATPSTFWTSTTIPDNTSKAWAVLFNVGYVNEPGLNMNSVRAVRGGCILNPKPDIQVTSPSCNFGDVVVDNTATLTFTVINTGNADLTIGNISLSSGATEFTVINDNCSEQTIASSGSCTFEVKFLPKSEGEKSVSLKIPSNDPDENLLTITLSGNGTLPQPDISVSLLTHNFGNIVIDNVAQQIFTVTNDGSANLNVGNLTLSSVNIEFSIKNDNCSGQTISPSDSCTFKVEFLPETTGQKGAILVIPSNDLDESSLTISITGNGVLAPQPKIGVLPQNPNFEIVTVGNSQVQLLTISNEGEEELTIGEITVLGDNADNFSMEEDNCSGTTITPGDNETIRLRFSPTSTGSKNALLRIPSNDPEGNPLEITLTGVGDNPASEDPPPITPTGEDKKDGGKSGLCFINYLARSLSLFRLF